MMGRHMPHVSRPVHGHIRQLHVLSPAPHAFGGARPRRAACGRQFVISGLYDDYTRLCQCSRVFVHVGLDGTCRRTQGQSRHRCGTVVDGLLTTALWGIKGKANHTHTEAPHQSKHMQHTAGHTQRQQHHTVVFPYRRSSCVIFQREKLRCA